MPTDSRRAAEPFTFSVDDRKSVNRGVGKTLPLTRKHGENGMGGASRQAHVRSSLPKLHDTCSQFMSKIIGHSETAMADIPVLMYSSRSIHSIHPRTCNRAPNPEK